MGNQLTTFDFNSNNIRVVDMDGEPWFVAADVARALGYSNPTVMVSPLDTKDRAKKFIGYGTNANMVFEPGLYQIVMRAQRTNPEARSFQDWAARTVLPAIRKDGGYIAGEELVATGHRPHDRRRADPQGDADAASQVWSVRGQLWGYS
jgi:prophage antirepressor-like protein